MCAIYIESEINFEFLIYAFGLAISLWVICCRWSTGNTAGFVEGCNELVDELGSSIASDGDGNAKVSNPMFDEQFCKSLRRKGIIGRYEDSLFGGFVDNNKNGIAAFGFGKRSYEIYRDILEWDRTRIDRVKRSFGLESMRLVLLTRRASFNVCCYVCFERVPVEVSLDKFNRFVDSRMACEWSVMVFCDNLVAIVLFRYESYADRDICRNGGNCIRFPELVGDADDLLIVVFAFIDIGRSRQKICFSVELSWSMPELQIILLQL
jgi:hypothetical protein